MALASRRRPGGHVSVRRPEQLRRNRASTIPSATAASQIDQSCLSELEHGVYASRSSARRPAAARSCRAGPSSWGRSTTSRSRRARATASARSIRATSARASARRSSAVQSRDLGRPTRGRPRHDGRPDRSRAILPDARRPGPHLRPDPGPQHALERLDAHGLVGRSSRPGELLRHRRERDAREGRLRRRPAIARPTAVCSSRTCRSRPPG